MMTPFQYRRSARNPVTALIVGAIWCALWAAWFWLEAAGWLMLVLGLFTLPALYDLIANPVAGLTLDKTRLAWFSARRHAEVTLDEIDHIRLDTRLDFSVRATVILHSGRKIRLPFESTPPHFAFESALEQHGLTSKRFHFQLLQ
jgi:hypothetical protein